MIHAAGDLALHGGRGAGLLLVEGRLRITGPVHFAGVIVALAGISSAADGARLEGAIRAGPRATWSSGPAVDLEGVSELRYSRCAVTRATLSSGRPRSVHGRSWAELF